MSDTITLGDLATALTFEAGIDGQTGTNGRHPLATFVYPLLNRVYCQLRSLVSQNGEDFFRTPGTATALPTQQSGEDWIQLPWPAGAAEIISVDVQLASKWYELVRGSWSQRRVFPGANRCESPGEWTVLSMPQPSTTTTTTGNIVVWPPTLSGNYKIDYLPLWTPITDATYVFVVFPDWVEWILAAAGMVICQRDNNKKDAYAIARDRRADAEERIIRHCRRSKRGVVAARRRDGYEL